MEKQDFVRTGHFIQKHYALNNNRLDKEIIKKGDLLGLINLTGDIILECKYAEIKSPSLFYFEFIKIKKGDFWGIIDYQGNWIISCTYSYISPISENGIFLVKFEDKWGTIDKFEKPISGLVFDDSWGETISRVKYENVNLPDDETWAFYKVALKNINRKGVYSYGKDIGLISGSTGKLVVPCKYYQIGNFINNIAIVKEAENLVGAINPFGIEIVPCKFEDVQAFGNGNILVKSAGKWVFYNFQMDVSNLFDLIHIDKDLKFAKQGENWGIIDQNGKTVVPFEFDDVKTESYREKISVKKGKYWYLVDLKNRKVTDCNYESTFEYRDGYGRIYFKDGFYGDYSNFEIKIPFDIESMDRTSEDGVYFNIKKNGKWGLIDRYFFSSYGKEFILDCHYDYPIINSVWSFRKSSPAFIFKISKNDKIGFIEISGEKVNQIIECQFENADILDKDLVIVKVGNKWQSLYIANGELQVRDNFDDWNVGFVKKETKWSLIGEDDYCYSNLKQFDKVGFFAEKNGLWVLIRILQFYNSEGDYGCWGSLQTYSNAYLRCDKRIIISNINRWQYVDNHVAKITSNNKIGLVSSVYKVKDKHSNYYHSISIFLECIYDSIEYNYTEGYTLLDKEGSIFITLHE